MILVGDIQKPQQSPALPAAQAENRPDFAAVLRDKIDASPLRFSKHADTRLSDRNISLSAEQLARIETGVAKARGKGIKNALVLADNAAFVVNIPNKTVITAVSGGDNNIFTNIDGAVIV
ncbi:MAG: flagellar protein [Clostridiales bacterium]|nr:flagellar protein [Clostridiales bacterium]